MGVVLLLKLQSKEKKNRWNKVALVLAQQDHLQYRFVYFFVYKNIKIQKERRSGFA